ncbi:hypothetical protein EDF70_102817 [Neorhizobium sp. JUb45]|nr:hypothetical protein EDF70_102817 [Neorhizobium sp. JUb45]
MRFLRSPRPILRKRGRVIFNLPFHPQKKKEKDNGTGKKGP